MRDPRAQPARLTATAAILLGAAPLLWPALLNRYPILFSDTGGLLEMGLAPAIGWDKPWVYGPLIAASSLHVTLWLPLLAQGALLSALLWIAAVAVSPPRPARHLLLCTVVGAGTAAPWITSTLMPDALTPIVPLGLFAVGCARLPRAARIGAWIGATVAIAAHLSHLIVAASCIAAIAVLRRAIPWRPLTCLASALAFLLASNWIGHGRPGVSPYGSVFALARLIGDGPARDLLDRDCPAAGYRLCAWRGRLGTDSDWFLWDPESPFWADDTPLPAFAAEASRIVRATIAAYPARVAAAAIGNGARQLGHFQLGDTLVPDHLAAAVRPRIAAWFPASELQRFDGAAQARGRLAEKVAPLLPLYDAVLAHGAAGCAVLLVRGLRRPSLQADFAALTLIALAANALATGALSTVHDRYQSRIAWLVLVPPALALSRARTGGAQPQAARFANSSGDIRTRPS